MNRTADKFKEFGLRVEAIDPAPGAFGGYIIFPPGSEEPATMIVLTEAAEPAQFWQLVLDKAKDELEKIEQQDRQKDAWSR